MILKPHQQIAVEKIRDWFTKAPSFLLADEKGLGKTRVACTIAKDLQPCLIVAPLSTHADWKKEAATVGLVIDQENCTLVNYESLHKIPDDKRFVLNVWDECARLKGWKTKRAQQFLSLRHRTARSLFMSATPAQSPMDMFYLHDLCGFQAGSCGYWKWLRSWDGLYKNRWDAFDWRTCPKDKERLKNLFSGNRPYLRRLPSDIEGWPEIQRILVSVQLKEKETRDIKDAFKEYIKIHGKRCLRGRFAERVALGQIQKKLSEVKTSHTIQFIRDNLEEGYCVTVACEFLQPAHDIAKTLYSASCRVKVVDGSTSAKEREMILDASARDELDCIVFTPMEGINLQQMQDTHRPRVQVCHDVRWSAMQQDQVDGRTHRAGRFAPVYWMSACNTLDESIQKRLKERFESMKTIVGDSDDFLLEVLQKEAGYGEKSESLQLEFDNISKQ